MRLIDADALIEYFEEMRSNLKPQDYKSAIEYETRESMLINFVQIFRLQPTVVQEQTEAMAMQYQEGYKDGYHDAKKRFETKTIVNNGTLNLEL